MKVKALKPFHDKVEGVARKIGDAFTVSEERLKEINSTKLGVLAVTEETAKPKKKPAKKPARKG